MATDYAQIAREHIEDYGKRTHHLELLKRLYADSTHFVYELIQNAEDAGATRMRLALSPDRLDVLHDGRSFDERDVRGICGVAEGSKEEDLTQIGKFGIGFKSVYAVTSRPEVHCGDEHFAIEHFVRPQALAAEHVSEPWTTVIRLPLNEPCDEDSRSAFEKIGERLRRLDPLTLLFLRRIREIAWSIAGIGHGTYRRDEPQGAGNPRRVWLVGEEAAQDSSSMNTTEEGWLVFSKDVKHLISDVDWIAHGRAAELRVELAFKDMANDRSDRAVIARLPRSPLVVFFPTELETRLGFLIQGPYRTTPARDNIPKDDHWNLLLMHETAKLAAECLAELKAQGLLTVRALEAMPLRQEDFPTGTPCEPIFAAVRQALREDALIPVQGGGFSTRTEVKLARGSDLRELLTGEELADLKGASRPLRWVTPEITEQNADLRTYILQELEVEEISPEDLARQISKQFLGNRSDPWIIRFYGFLHGHKALWREAGRGYWDHSPAGLLRSKPIIRLSDGNHVAPFGSDALPEAYLPLEEFDASDGDLPTVKADIVADEMARVFLQEDLKLPAPDAVARILERVLPRYHAGHPAVISERNRVDLRRVIEALEKASSARKRELQEAVRDTAAFRATSYADGAERYRLARDIYIDCPELRGYLDGNPDAWHLCCDYSEDHRRLARDLGARDQVGVSCRPALEDGTVPVRDQWGWHERGIAGFDPDFSVDGLEWALGHISIAKARFIWNCIAVQYANHLKGVKQTRKDQRNDWENHSVFSPLGHSLATTAWLPGKGVEDNCFVLPKELSLEDLPEGFERSSKVAEALGMRSDERERAAQQLGVGLDEVELVRRLREHPEFHQRVIEWLEREEGIDFPRLAVRDVQRRKLKVASQAKVAVTKRREHKNRAMRPDHDRPAIRQNLMSLYTNTAGEMVCQLCHKIMPFRKPDGQFYFESVELLSTFEWEMDQVYLALCPTCAAKYKVYVKEMPEEMERVRDQIQRRGAEDGESLSIHVDLGKEEPRGSIWFVEPHLLDIQTILEEMPSSR